MARPKDDMTPEEISAAEIKIIRWGEKILTPLLVTGLTGIIVFLSDVHDTVAQLEGEHKLYNAHNGDVKEHLQAIEKKLDGHMQYSNTISVELKRIETRQDYIREEIKELRGVNKQILHILQREDRE